MTAANLSARIMGDRETRKWPLQPARAGFPKCESGNLLYPGFNPGLFCRALYPKTGLILSLSKDLLFGNAL
jgi:hypothetical protein